MKARKGSSHFSLSPRQLTQFSAANVLDPSVALQFKGKIELATAWIRDLPDTKMLNNGLKSCYLSPASSP